MANYQPYRSPFGDTTYTKVFVGGLAWETPTDKMRAYFEQFGDILEAVIITDKNTGKSKGYGFVTFRDADSAQRAVVDANPMIDGRRANCNIASLGRQRPSPPRGRNDQGGGASSSYHTGMPTPMQALQPHPAPPMVYPPYGYTYTPGYGYHQMQGLYSPQLQQAQQYYAAAAAAAQMYGTSSSSLSMAGNLPYHHYGYSMPTSRGSTFPSPSAAAAGASAHRILASPSAAYFYYPSTTSTTTTTTTNISGGPAGGGSRSGTALMEQQGPFNPYAPPFPSSQHNIDQAATSRDQAPSSSGVTPLASLGGDSQYPAPQRISSETREAVVVTSSESQNA